MMSDNPDLEVIKGDPVQEVTPDLAYKRLGIVNVAFYGQPNGPWVLIDAGIPGTAHSIREAAKERFGSRAPEAVVLTHGHFDHVGALESLADEWDVRVYAHRREPPYRAGRSASPPPDPAGGGGMMARTSFVYPKGPIDVSARLRPLPEDGSVPGMAGWRWLHTPGHTPGHVSLWRDLDRLLVAGDAFVTTRAESVYAVAVQKPEVHGPPRYYTPDWGAAEGSVKVLAALEPETVVSGHGPALRGPELRADLHRLADDFQTLAVPDKGRYVGTPARVDESGTTFVPDKPSGGSVPVLAAAGALAARGPTLPVAATLAALLALMLPTQVAHAAREADHGATTMAMAPHVSGAAAWAGCMVGPVLLRRHPLAHNETAADPRRFTRSGGTPRTSCTRRAAARRPTSRR